MCKVAFTNKVIKTLKKFDKSISKMIDNIYSARSFPILYFYFYPFDCFAFDS